MKRIDVSGPARVTLTFTSFALALFPALVSAVQADDSNSGVDGNSYTSPSFGYYIEWGREWDVTDELNEEEYNKLVLDNGTSSVYLEGITDPSSTEDCVQSLVQNLERTDGVDDVVQMESPDGEPVGGSERNRDWAVYNLTYTSDGDPVDFSEYIDCRPIVAGESLLVITMLTGADDFEDESDQLFELLDGLALEGPSETNQPDESEIDEAPESGEFADIENMVVASSTDIDEFWEREFPGISGGRPYVAPAAVISYSEEIEGCNATLTPGEIGPIYCYGNQTIYYDLPWALEQTDAFGTMSLVAMDIAHEVGHHVQGLMEWKECKQTPCLDKTEMTSQEFELQADCFSGAWMADAETRGRMGSFDIESNIAQYALVLGDPAGNVADRGAHGSAASRIFWLLNGYFFGVDTCLTVSPATNPDRSENIDTNGDNENVTPEATNEGEPTAESTAEPETTPDSEIRELGDEYVVEFSDQTLTMSVESTEITDSIASEIEPEGEFLVVYVQVQRDGEAPGPVRYTSFVVTDSDGNEYRLDEAATDELLRTAYPDGVDENLDLGARYNIAFVFDVDPSATGFVFSTSTGEGAVQLDV